MRTAPLNRQDGFIREVLWLAVIVGVVAIVLLDALSMFNAHQSSHDNASSAVREAQTEYAQSLNVAQAELAAQQYLQKSGVTLVAFKSTGMVDGAMGFSVTTKAHAKTYAFKYLTYIPGTEEWVKTMLNPVSTESGD